MHSRLTTNCGYAGMGDLEWVVDYHTCAFLLHWFSTAISKFAISLKYNVHIETKGLIGKQTTLHVMHTFADGQHLST